MTQRIEDGPAWFNNRIVRTVRIEDGPAKQYPDYTYQNAEKSKTYGFDVNAQVRLPFDLTLRGTYSYVNDDEKVQGKRSSYIRPHTAVMQADYTRRFPTRPSCKPTTRAASAVAAPTSA